MGSLDDITMEMTMKYTCDTYTTLELRCYRNILRMRSLKLSIHHEKEIPILLNFFNYVSFSLLWIKLLKKFWLKASRNNWSNLFKISHLIKVFFLFLLLVKIKMFNLSKSWWNVILFTWILASIKAICFRLMIKEIY